MNPHSRVALLPWVPYTRKVLIFKGTRIKSAGTPTTVGEHVLKKRLEDRFDRKQLAARFRVDECTLMNWELGRTKEIPARAMPGVIGYLGYNPEPEPTHIGARLRWKRRALGWSIKEAARRNSVDPSTWEQWEKSAGWPAYPRYRELLEELVNLPTNRLANWVGRVRAPTPRRGSRQSRDW